MRLPTLLDTDLFAEAELCALRLDGDCVAVGDRWVAADAPVDAAVRAAAIASDADRYGLVAADRIAAWIHGVAPLPPRPLRFTVDLSDGVRTRMLPVAPHELRFAAGEVTRIAGLRVTTPLRTALDLARLEDDFAGFGPLAVAALLELARATPAEAAAVLAAGPKTPNKRRALDRLRSLQAVADTLAA